MQTFLSAGVYNLFRRQHEQYADALVTIDELYPDRPDRADQ